MDDSPTTKPTKEIIEAERRFVESAQITREVYRDSWMDDDETLRFHCINAAISAIEKPLFDKDAASIQSQRIIDMADDFYDYVRNGTANTVAS